MHINAPITNISRGSLHDGPGIRTVIYFKGCGLKCKWCHNPETLSSQKQILYIKSKCIHCGKCVEVCPEHHKVVDNDILFLRDGCKRCGKCAVDCPAMALEICGEYKSVDEVFEEIKKDYHYYEISGGGVTFSGGECLLHTDFVIQLAEKCRQNRIHTAAESALYVPWENVSKVIPFIDLFFVDLKIPSSQKHKKYTEKDNKLIIDNIQKLSKMHSNIILRIPIIPNVNDSDEDLDEFAKIINSSGSDIKEIELLKYNNLAESKYNIVGREYTKFADNSQTDEEMKRLCTILTEKCNKKCYFV